MQNITKLCLILSLVCLGACKSESTDQQGGMQTQSSKTGDETRPEAGGQADSPEGKALLQRALSTMGSLKSAHVEATMVTGKTKVPVHGELATNGVDLTIERADGIRARHIVIGSDEVVSMDGGKSWGPDKEHSGTTMSSFVTFLFTPATGALAQEPVTLIGKEPVGGQPATHLRIEGGKNKSPIDVWVSEIKGVGAVVSRYRGVIAATDMELDADLVYSKFNQPVSIKLPK